MQVPSNPSPQDGDGRHVFHVWAPFARGVSVAGTFNGWSEDATPLESLENGYWSAAVSDVRANDEYKIAIRTTNAQGQESVLWRNDAVGRGVRHSTGNSVIDDDAFDWGPAETSFEPPTKNALVIYELHVGTFEDEPGGAPGTFESAVRGLDRLKELGVNAVELMPVAEFSGDFSWGYNPAHPYAVETAYGGPEGLKAFVRAAHARGIAVVIDVVYNHFGPSDLSLWRFDGWSENDLGGIYFFNDWRAQTPWGATRPDFGRREVRQYIYDNARMWLAEYHADGLRWDSTVNIRSRENGFGGDIPDGWEMMRRATQRLKAEFPRALLFAEDLQGVDAITISSEQGGAGFDAQWDAGFVHPVRNAVITAQDQDRDIFAVRDAVVHAYSGGPFDRVVYTESHDEVANGRSRVPEEIWPGHADSWSSRKRSTLGAALVLTSPGVPFLFQGQEILEDEWFRDTDPVDWAKATRFAGILALYRDLIRLRLDRDGTTKGLAGRFVNAYHANNVDKILAYHRYEQGGPHDDVVAVVNLSSTPRPAYEIGFPRAGRWRLRFDSDSPAYGSDLGAQLGADLEANGAGRDGLPASGSVRIGPYTAQIYSQGD